jgi:hypothetical protein
VHDTCPLHLILLDLILTTFSENTNYEAPHNAIFFSFLSLHHS